MNERFVTMEAKRLALNGSELTVGSIAPDFTLLDTSLKFVSLKDFGTSNKLISVVPSLDTGVCSKQTRHFNEQAGALENVKVITISVDLPFAQDRWCGSEGLDNVITLSDHYDVSFGRDYGTLIGELRLLARAVFVLNSNNKITYVEYVPELTDHPDYDQALAALNKL